MGRHDTEGYRSDGKDVRGKDAADVAAVFLVVVVEELSLIEYRIFDYDHDNNDNYFQACPS